MQSAVCTSAALTGGPGSACRHDSPRAHLSQGNALNSFIRALSVCRQVVTTRTMDPYVWRLVQLADRDPTTRQWLDSWPSLWHRCRRERALATRCPAQAPGTCDLLLYQVIGILVARWQYVLQKLPYASEPPVFKGVVGKGCFHLPPSQLNSK